MANRRMFSNRIANSARFLQMPAETQLLYFHMVLRADDDGIVEAYPLTKLLGLATDNFKVLLAKNFIKQLNEDQVIVITDWQEHNTIRADRKVNSIYLPLLQEKYPELPLIEPKPRSDVEDNSRRLVGGQSTDGISKVKLSKDKLIGDKSPTLKDLFLKEIGNVEGEGVKFIDYWTEKNPNGKKERWQMERVFDIKRRWRTWQNNQEKFKGRSFTPKIVSPYKEFKPPEKFEGVSEFAKLLAKKIPKSEI